MEVKLGDTPVIKVDQKAKKDWIWDFRGADNGTGNENIMEDGDAVASLTIVPPTGITVTAGPTIINNSTAVQVWFEFSGGTLGENHKVEASLVTTQGRAEEFPVVFYIVDF